jgi:hypothetical protein
MSYAHQDFIYNNDPLDIFVSLKMKNGFKENYAISLSMSHDIFALEPALHVQITMSVKS